MKKRFIPILLLCALLSSCTVPTIDETCPTTVESTEVPVTPSTTNPLTTVEKLPFTFVDEKQPNPNGYSFGGKYGEEYNSMSVFFIRNFLTDEQEDYYGEIFEKTYTACYGHFCEYFNISKEEYAEYWDAFKEDFNEHWVINEEEISESFEHTYHYERDYDEWFSPDYFENPIFLYDEYEAPEIADFFEYVPEDTVHTSTYYRIEHRLIEAVTEEKFNVFLDKYKGKDRNILNFIDYFKITREQFDEIYSEKNTKWGDANIYKADYIYGDEKMQSLYFCKQDIATFAIDVPRWYDEYSKDYNIFESVYGVYTGFEIDVTYPSPNEEYGLKISVPQINSDKRNAEFLNMRIADKLLNMGISFQIKDETPSTHQRSEYKVYKRGSVIVIEINTESCDLGIMKTTNKVEVYYYDIDKDEILTLDEYIESYTESDITPEYLLEKCHENELSLPADVSGYSQLTGEKLEKNKPNEDNILAVVPLSDGKSYEIVYEGYGTRAVEEAGVTVRTYPIRRFTLKP